MISSGLLHWKATCNLASGQKHWKKTKNRITSTAKMARTQRRKNLASPPTVATLTSAARFRPDGLLGVDFRPSFPTSLISLKMRNCPRVPGGGFLDLSPSSWSTSSRSGTRLWWRVRTLFLSAFWLLMGPSCCLKRFSAGRNRLATR